MSFVKSSIFSAVAIAVALTSGAASAKDDMEKCNITKDSKVVLKEHKSDCKSTSHDCAGQNKAGDESWIMVPKGQCDKINKGDLSGLKNHKGVEEKLELKK